MDNSLLSHILSHDLLKVLFEEVDREESRCWEIFHQVNRGFHSWIKRLYRVCAFFWFARPRQAFWRPFIYLYDYHAKRFGFSEIRKSCVEKNFCSMHFPWICLRENLLKNVPLPALKQLWDSGRGCTSCCLSPLNKIWASAFPRLDYSEIS